MRIRHPRPDFFWFPVPILLLLFIACAPDQVGEPAGPSLQARVKVPSFVGQDLGVLPGDNQSSGFGVNNAGQVVGQSAGTSGTHAFYWDGALHDLTTPGSVGAAYAISSGATAHAVGYERSAGQRQRAVMWALPSTTPLTLEPGPSSAMGVNDAGSIVGTYCSSLCGTSTEIWNAAIWSAAGPGRVDIEPLPGHNFAYGTDINNDGLVVGASYGPGTAEQAYLRKVDGARILLPPLPNFPSSVAYALSDVVGGLVYVAGASRDGNGNGQGTRWTIEVSSGLITAIIGLDQRWAEGVNSAGDVAGTGGSPSNPAASLFKSGTYFALKAPKGASGSVARGMARGAGPPGYVVGETSVRGWPRALLWVIP